MNQISLWNTSRSFSNEDIGFESLKIIEPLCSEKTLQFGRCEVSEVHLRIRTSETMIGETYKLRLQTENDVYEWTGYTVISDKPTADQCYRDIVLVDKLYDVINADVAEWYNAILPDMNASVTLGAFRESFFRRFGLLTNAVDLVNDAVQIKRTIAPVQLTGERVLHDICEVNGCFGHMSRDGNFQYVILDEIDASGAFPEMEVRTAKNEDFETERISKVQIRTDEDDVGAIYGDGENCYVLQDNFLLYGKTAAELATIAQNLYGVISRIWYMPATITATADPGVLVGQSLRIESNHSPIYTYVLNRTISGIQSLKDVITAKGTQMQSEKVATVNDSLIQLRGKANRLERDVEHNALQITDVERNLTNTISQAADDFNLKIEEIQSEIDGSLTVFTGDYDPTLKNIPAMDWTYNIPVNNTVRLRNDLKFEYKDEYWKRHSRSVFFNETTGASYRFEKRNGIWSWYPIADTEYGYVLQRIAEVDVKTDSVTTTVAELEKTVTEDYITTKESQAQIVVAKNQIMQTVSNDYTSKSQANETFETKVHADTAYRQTADSITQEARRASAAEGNLSAAVKIQADELDAEIKRAKAEEGSLSTKINVTAEGLAAESTRAAGAEERLSGRIDLNAREISAKVSETGGTSSSFGWSLNSSGFKLVASGSDVLKASKDGIIIAGYATANELNAQKARIDTIAANYISAYSVSSEYAKITSLNTVSGRVSNLEADHVTVNDLRSATARIGSLESDHVKTADFDAATARIGTLEADHVKTTEFSSATARIGTLESDYSKLNKAVIGKASVTDLNAAIGRISNLEATRITADYINAKNICGVLNSPTDKTSIAVGSVSTSAFYYYSGAGYESMYPMNVTINGKTYHLFGHV